MDETEQIGPFRIEPDGTLIRTDRTEFELELRESVQKKEREMAFCKNMRLDITKGVPFKTEIRERYREETGEDISEDLLEILIQVNRACTDRLGELVLTPEEKERLSDNEEHYGTVVSEMIDTAARNGRVPTVRQILEELSKAKDDIPSKHMPKEL